MLYPFLPGSHYQWIARLLGIIVLGGMGSLPGAVIGALCLGVAELMTVTYIGPEWATGVPYVFVFIVLLLRPQGILGHAAARGRGHGMTDAGATAVAEGTLKGGGAPPPRRRPARCARRGPR